MKFIDLSHVIEDGLVTYKGLPAPVICDFWSREESKQFYDGNTSFQIGKIEMVSNTGTYMDTPFHRFQDGNDLSEIGIEQTAMLEGIILRVPFQRTCHIDWTLLEGLPIKNRAVLIHTGWDAHWNTETYYSKGPYLSADAAAYLVQQEATLVGIDSHNIDDTSVKNRPVHSILLKANILIVEHLCNLGAIPENVPFKFSATPPKIKGMGTFPVRAYATLED